MNRSVEDSKAIPSVLISLVVVRQPNRPNQFVATHEYDGWYLPAGRADLGEALTTGAKREALEEAGIPVNLTGLLRLEHTPRLKSTRVRAIFAACPADETPLKSEPDHEIIEAQWVTIEDLQQKHLRAYEVIELFQFAASGTRLHPISVLEEEDATTVNHKKVVSQLIYSTVVIIKRGDNILANRSKLGKWEVPRVVLPNGKHFHTAATAVIYPETGVYLTLDFILKISHKPPPNESSIGSLQVIYIGHIMEKFSNELVHDNYKWFSCLEEFLTDSDVSESAKTIAQLYKQTPQQDLCSVNMIAMETDEYTILR